MYRIDIQGTSYTAPDLATLQQWVNEGRVMPDNQVWIEGENRWIPAREVSGLVVAQPYANVGPAGYPRMNQGPYVPVQNNLVLAILTTLCCCMPLGVASIVFAAQVDGLARSGNTAKAQESANRAKTIAIIGIVLGGLFQIGYLILVLSGEVKP
jgi:hypothetical protein